MGSWEEKDRGTMDVMQRKERLKQIILNSKCSYDLLIYRLLNKKCLNEIISCIDDIPVACDTNPNEMISAEEQFIVLLNRFILYYRKTFHMQSLDEFIIEYIIVSNFEEMKVYLLSKHYQGDNQYISFFNDSIYRLLVHNFIENATYMPIIQEMLKEANIDMKEIGEYDLKEIYQIKDLLSDLVFCCTDKFPVVYLFQLLNLEYSKCQKKYLLGKRSHESEWRNFQEHRENILKQFQTQYQIIFEEYHKRKKYLSYFR